MYLKYYSQSYFFQKNASVKPRTDFEEVLERMGASPLGLKSRTFVHKVMYRVYAIINLIVSWILMTKGNLVFFQYPYQIGIRSIFYRAVRRGNSTCLLIHDLDELRPIKYDPYTDLLEHADYLIVHTKSMAEWLRTHHKIKGTIIVLDLFDYIYTPQNKLAQIEKHKNIKVAFCGNLKKSEFLTRMSIPEGITMVIYGLDCPLELQNNPRVDYRGVATPNELPDLICDCNYGLVWDGKDASGMTDLQGTYLQYNAPHKVSLYLSSGLPVMIWEKMGISEFISVNGIGVSGRNINDLFYKVLKLKEDEIINQKNNVNLIKQKLCTGGMYENALKKVIVEYESHA